MNQDTKSDAAFLPSKARKRRKGRGQTKLTFPEKLSRAKSELNCPLWLEGHLDSMLQELKKRHTQDILCLGLGSPSNSLVACAQLVLLLHLQQLILEPQSVLIYDPVFDDEDVIGLKELGFEVLSATQSQICYNTFAPRLFFLPHCELWLYEALVRANWTPDGLSSLLMISNSFHTYSDKLLAKEMRNLYPCVWRLTPLLKCLPLPRSPSHETAFTELAIQFIDSSQHALPPRDDTFWTLAESDIRNE